MSSNQVNSQFVFKDKQLSENEYKEEMKKLNMSEEYARLKKEAIAAMKK
jgi:hypothetical protein